MNKLFPIFKNLMKRKSSWLYLLCGLFPLILFIVTFFNTEFMQLSGEKNSLSFVEFFSSVNVVQSSATIPLIILLYIINTTFYTEKVSGQMFFYKDISRITIFNNKLLSLIILYILFLGVLFLSSLVTYYSTLSNNDIFSNTFLPTDIEDFQYALIEFFGTTFISILCILLGVLLSIYFSAGYTILGVIIFFIITSIAPFLKSLKYIFPNGYLSFLETNNFNKIILIITLMFLIYSCILYLISLWSYRRIEF